MRARCRHFLHVIFRHHAHPARFQVTAMTPASMRNEVSIIIKTFERPRTLDRLLRSILASPAGDCSILIADDSFRPAKSELFSRENIQYFKLPYDSGLSHGRNYLVERVKTPYCALLDDDFFFIAATRLDIFLDIVKNKGFDLAAGKYDGPQWGPGCGILERVDDNLSIKMGAPPRSTFNGLPVYDFTNNFFLARTETLRDIPWDNRFKIYGEHTDFFLRYSAKYRITFAEEVAIGHESSGYSLRGGLLRHGPSRGCRSLRILARKHGFKRFHGRYVFGVRGVVNCFLPMFGIMLGHGLSFLRRRFA
jgi:glycosyltransferase involved in cell wall biosynthesis